MSMLFSWKTTPILRRTSAGSRATSWPMIRPRPPEGTIRVERMRKVVVLPLPLGPSSPKISAGRTSNETPAKRGSISVLVAEVLQLDYGRRGFAGVCRDCMIDGFRCCHVGSHR